MAQAGLATTALFRTDQMRDACGYLAGRWAADLYSNLQSADAGWARIPDDAKEIEWTLFFNHPDTVSEAHKIFDDWGYAGSTATPAATLAGCGSLDR